MTIFLFSVGIERIDFPSSRISPLSGLIKPVIILRIVVLPHPDSPTSPNVSPLNISNETIIDPKTRLQEFSLKKFKSLPIYNLVSSSGPKHKPNFTISVRLKDTKLYEVSGDSKKKAEQSAAKILLDSLI